MSDEEDNVIDLRMRRATQRQQEEVPARTEDAAYMAANELTRLMGELATKMSATDLLAGVILARRTLDVMLETAVGRHHRDRIKVQATERAAGYKIASLEHYRGPTVFDKEKDVDSHE